MLGSVDYVGIAAVIAAFTGLLGTIFGFLTHRAATDTNTKVTGQNGVSIAQTVEATAEKLGVDTTTAAAPSFPPAAGEATG